MDVIRRAQPSLRIRRIESIGLDAGWHKNASGPVWNDAPFPAAVGAPVRTTTRRLSSLESSLQVVISCFNTGLLTMLSFLGFEMDIVATLWPGECSLVVLMTLASLAASVAALMDMGLRLYPGVEVTDVRLRR